MSQLYDSTFFKTTKLFELTDRIFLLSCGATMLSFDAVTGAPKGGSAVRGRAEAYIAAEAFKIAVSDEMRAAIEELEALENLDAITAAAVRQARREYDSRCKIPVHIMREFSELTTEANHVWEDAKVANDFKAFAPYLARIIDYNKTFIDYRGYTGVPYNTLLDDYELGMTTDKLDIFFGTLKNTIVPLLKRITEAEQIDDSFVTRYVPKDKQKAISELLMNKLGYDRNRGQLRESAHPFTTGFGSAETRITTHYYDQSFFYSMYSVIHETGHALYELGKMPEIASTMLDDGVSMGVHESQSRFYENVIGRSRAFWELIYDELIAILGDEWKGIPVESFYRAANKAEPSFIRTEADELTYSLHIMVRYEIEKAIFAGGVSVDELPELWNAKYKEYLGITPPTDTVGVLQDTHWSGGSFGYFPSYSLGNAYAAQILNTMNKEIDLEALIRADKISEITTWLGEKIHKFGKIKPPAQLFTDFTGEDLNAEHYVKYLNNKFEGLYNLK